MLWGDARASVESRHRRFSSASRAAGPGSKSCGNRTEQPATKCALRFNDLQHKVIPSLSRRVAQLAAGNLATDHTNSKQSMLRAPATISTCSERSPVSGDLFAFVAALSIAAKFPFSSILSSPSVGVRMMASTSPRSASVASTRVSGLPLACRHASAVQCLADSVPVAQAGGLPVLDPTAQPAVCFLGQVLQEKGVHAAQRAAVHGAAMHANAHDAA